MFSSQNFSRDDDAFDSFHKRNHISSKSDDYVPQNDFAYAR